MTDGTFQIPGSGYRGDLIEVRLWQRGDGAMCSFAGKMNNFACGEPVVTAVDGRKSRLCRFHLGERFRNKREDHSPSSTLKPLCVEELIARHRQEFAEIMTVIAAELEAAQIARIPQEIRELLEEKGDN